MDPQRCSTAASAATWSPVNYSQRVEAGFFLAVGK
jgi:hypothetical protein